MDADVDDRRPRLDPVGPDLFRPLVGRGCAYADVNGDGYPDVVLTENGGPARLLINEGRTGWQAPAPGQASGLANAPQAQLSYSPGGSIQSGINLTGSADPSNILTSYGPADNFSADRQRVQDALMSRIISGPSLDPS